MRRAQVRLLALTSSYYYVRLQQVDGHVAWGSPIWIVRPGGGS